MLPAAPGIMRSLSPRPPALDGILSRCAAKDRSGGNDEPDVAIPSPKSCATALSMTPDFPIH